MHLIAQLETPSTPRTEPTREPHPVGWGVGGWGGEVGVGCENASRSLKKRRISHPCGVLASGSEAQVWHLNVHSDGRADGPAGGVICGTGVQSAGLRRRSLAPHRRASGTVRRVCTPRPACTGGFGASVGRRRAGGWRGGGPFFSRIPPWRAHFARFSRVRAAMRTAPGARKVGPDDTDELRE
eukprot:gene21040-biopygen16158